MNRSTLRLLCPLLASTIAACCHTSTPADMVDRPSPPAVAAPTVVPHENLNSVVWVQTAAEYRAAAIQAFATAEKALDRELSRTHDSAAVEQSGDYSSLPPAIIVDIDDTVLDNSPFEARLIESGGPYTSEGWNQWVREASAAPVPGAVEFAKHAAASGVTVFYISNRDASVEGPTRVNLAAAGFPVDTTTTDVVLTKGERPEWKGDNKTPRRQEVASHYRVLLLVGDNLGDFVADDQTTIAQRAATVDRYRERWGSQWIVVPNPMYGSWEGAAINYQRSLSAEDQLRLKRGVLRTAPNH